MVQELLDHAGREDEARDRLLAGKCSIRGPSEQSGRRLSSSFFLQIWNPSGTPVVFWEGQKLRKLLK